MYNGFHENYSTKLSNTHERAPAHTGPEPRNLFNKSLVDSYPRNFKFREIKALYGTCTAGVTQSGNLIGNCRLPDRPLIRALDYLHVIYTCICHIGPLAIKFIFLNNAHPSGVHCQLVHVHVHVYTTCVNMIYMYITCTCTCTCMHTYVYMYIDMQTCVSDSP